MDYQIRSATVDDVRQLAELQVMASEGITDALYHDLVPDLSTAKIVERTFFFPNSVKSFENCWVATLHSAVVGSLHAYPIDLLLTEPPDPLVPKERLGVLKPFAYLDMAAAGSYHINTVAVMREHRSRGVGSSLLEFAFQQAIEQSFASVSLSVFEGNSRAIELYHRVGFRELIRRLAPSNRCLTHAGDIVMMIRKVSCSA